MTVVLVILGAVGWFGMLVVAVLARRNFRRWPEQQATIWRPQRLVVAPDVAESIPLAKPRTDVLGAGQVGVFAGLPVVVDPTMAEGTWRAE